jgi:hypothetical protein
MDLYPNRWYLVNQIEDFGRWWYIENNPWRWNLSKLVISCQMAKYQLSADIQFFLENFDLTKKRYHNNFWTLILTDT